MSDVLSAHRTFGLSDPLSVRTYRGVPSKGSDPDSGQNRDSGNLHDRRLGKLLGVEGTAAALNHPCGAVGVVSARTVLSIASLTGAHSWGNQQRKGGLD